MPLTIAIAIVAGLGWGLNIVATRWAVDRTGVSSDIGAVVSIASAAVLAMVLALAIGDTTGLDWNSVGRFALVGLIAPGSAQMLFFAAIAAIGPARAGVYIGTSPMFAVVLAIVLIGEDLRAAVIVGTILTVVGGVTLSWERSAGPLLTLGAVFAIGTAVAFGLRDVVAREFTSGTELAPAWAATVVLGSGTVVLVAIAAVRQGSAFGAGMRRAVPELLVSGVLIGLALPSLLWALSRGAVGTVSPLSNGAQVLTVVVVSMLVFGRSDPPVRLLTAAVLVIAGGTLIGISA